MNYTICYNRIIERALNRVLEGYCERHHIIPRCMGGSDEADNIAVLTAREHYIAHQLLVKIYPDNALLVKAAVMMTMDSNGGRVGNRLYEWLKIKNSEAQSKLMKGSIPWNKGKVGVFSDETIKQRTTSRRENNNYVAWNKGLPSKNNPLYKIPRTQEVKNKISQGNTGKVRSKTTRKLLSEIGLANPSRGHLGHTHSENTKAHWSKIRKGKMWIYKNGQTTTIHKDQLQLYLDTGWKKGRKANG